MDEMEFELQEVWNVFLAETDENLAAVEAALLQLEEEPDNAELLHVVFRAAHTLKGDAGNLGFRAVSEFAHQLEDLLDGLRDGTVRTTGEHVALLLRAVDALRVMVPAAVQGEEDTRPEHRALLEQLHAAARGAAGEVLEPVLSGGRPAAEAAAAPPEASAAGRSAAEGRTLRVDLERLDAMLNLVGEIAIARNRVAQLLRAGASGAAVLEAHTETDRLYLDLRDVLMRLRMVPLGPVFQRYVRTVRDVAFQNGKLARLDIRGEEVEVDTAMVEHLRDPLLHVLRNAVDHGVEPPEVRTRAGKDPVGTVRISAAHEGSNIVIRVADDGAGLNRARIVERATAAGLVTRGDTLTDAEVNRLIFAPGFSTAERVTELSGRGVGLDVVRENIRKMRGSIEVAGQPGEGTTLTLRLPLTLAIIDGFYVGAAEETYVIPLDSVSECLELPRAERQRSQRGSGVLHLPGRSLPFFRLRHVFGHARADPTVRESVVVVEQADRQMGLVVDALHGEGQTVIKPLGRAFRHVEGLAGATILGTGRVGLILDVPALVRRVGEQGRAAVGSLL